MFPNDLKAAEVSPIYKNNNRLDKYNYRILSCISKHLESVYVDQLIFYFDLLFSPTLSGFRNVHNCQYVRIDFNEKCKSSLDNKKIDGALLSYVSRALDCMCSESKKGGKSAETTPGYS